MQHVSSSSGQINWMKYLGAIHPPSKFKRALLNKIDNIHSHHGTMNSIDLIAKVENNQSILPPISMYHKHASVTDLGVIEAQLNQDHFKAHHFSTSKNIKTSPYNFSDLNKIGARGKHDISSMNLHSN
jgi:hypothetical protein